VLHLHPIPDPASGALSVLMVSSAFRRQAGDRILSLGLRCCQCVAISRSTRSLRRPDNFQFPTKNGRKKPKKKNQKNNKMANRIIIIVVRVCEWYSRGFVLSNWFMAILVRCCAVVAVAVAVSVAIGV